MLPVLILSNLNTRAYGKDLPIPAAVRSKAWVCGRWTAGIVDSNPVCSVGFLSLVFMCYSVRGLCDGPTPYPEVTECVCPCMGSNAVVTLYTSNEVGRRGCTKKNKTVWYLLCLWNSRGQVLYDLLYLGAFAKSRKRLLGTPCLSVRPSVSPHGTTRLSPDGLS